MLAKISPLTLRHLAFLAQRFAKAFWGPLDGPSWNCILGGRPGCDSEATKLGFALPSQAAQGEKL